MTEEANKQQFYIDEFNKKDYDYIHLIENPSDEILFEYALNVDSNYFKKIKNQTNEMGLKMLEKNLENISIIEIPTLEHWMYIYNIHTIISDDIDFKHRTDTINYYLDLNYEHDREFCKMLIHKDINILRRISKLKLSQELCDYIFKKICEQKNFKLFFHIPLKYYTAEMCSIMLELDAKNIEYVPIEFLSNEIFEKMIKRDYKNIIPLARRTFKEKMYEILEMLVKVDNRILLCYDKYNYKITLEEFVNLNKIALKLENKDKNIIGDISDKDAWRCILSYNGNLIKECPIIDEELALIAVKQNPLSNFHIKTYYDSVWKHLLSLDGNKLYSCPNKTLSNCKIAYAQNNNAKLWIPLKYRLLFC